MIPKLKVELKQNSTGTATEWITLTSKNISICTTDYSVPITNTDFVQMP